MKHPELMLTTSDLDPEFFASAAAAERVGCDIETSGLDWRTSRIATCQVALDTAVNVVMFPADAAVPSRLSALLESSRVQKVFHHAPFDVRFMMAEWRVRAKNIACTKIASKILDPQLAAAEHSLKPVLKRHLGLNISKQEQLSNWTADRLTSGQVRYAVDDVLHLVNLARVLESMAHERDRHRLLRASWDYVPYRAQLDLDGAGDVFVY